MNQYSSCIDSRCYLIARRLKRGWCILTGIQVTTKTTENHRKSLFYMLLQLTKFCISISWCITQHYLGDCNEHLSYFKCFRTSWYHESCCIKWKMIFHNLCPVNQSWSLWCQIFWHQWPQSLHIWSSFTLNLETYSNYLKIYFD